jgi:hypothetical protein
LDEILSPILGKNFSQDPGYKSPGVDFKDLNFGGTVFDKLREI